MLRNSYRAFANKFVGIILGLVRVQRVCMELCVPKRIRVVSKRFSVTQIDNFRLSSLRKFMFKTD